MAYGDYSGPDKADKGKECGSCNRRLCQCAPARWYNHGSYSWYCDDCRQQIEFDPVNSAGWQRDFYPRLQHPMFETREMMDARQNPAPETTAEEIHRCPICAEPFKPDDLCASDITEGVCHAECLEGSPVVDLDTGDELPDGKVDTFPYSEVSHD